MALVIMVMPRLRDKAGTKRMTEGVKIFVTKLLEAGGGQAGFAGGWLTPSTSPSPSTKTPSPTTKTPSKPTTGGWVTPSSSFSATTKATTKPTTQATTKPTTKATPILPKKTSHAAVLLTEDKEERRKPKKSHDLDTSMAVRRLVGEEGLKGEVGRMVREAGLEVPGARGRSRSPNMSNLTKVSESTRVVNGRKVSTRVEVRAGVETREVREDGRLVARTVAGSKIPV